jgi:hypothetical protein
MQLHNVKLLPLLGAMPQVHTGHQREKQPVTQAMKLRAYSRPIANDVKIARQVGGRDLGLTFFNIACLSDRVGST